VLYDGVQPPFIEKFKAMGKKDLRPYFQWFLCKIPDGISELVGEVRRVHIYEDWQPDCTPDSLDLLGEWFSQIVETRQRTYLELEELRYNSPFPVDISTEELTDRTFSLSVDMAMYVSQVFIRSFPSLRWDQPFGSKRFISYGQPVLIPFDCGEFNPVHMMVTLAYGLVAKRKTGARLRAIFDIWSTKVIS